MTTPAPAAGALHDARGELELVDAQLVGEPAGAVAPARAAIEQCNFFAEAERIAQRGIAGDPPSVRGDLSLLW